MNVKEESSKVGLKLNVQKKKKDHGLRPHHFMPNIYGNNGNSERFYFGWSFKITADGDFSHEIKGHFLFGRKAMTKLDSILKCRDIALSTKFCLGKAAFYL